MPTVTFPFNQPGMVSIGAVDTGAAWGGGGTGGNRVSQNLPVIWDFLVTGTTAVGSGGYYMSSQSSITFTLMDTSGNVLAQTTGATTSPPMTATSTFQNASVNLFPTFTMVATTTYWVRIYSTMGGGGLLQTNNLVQLTGPTSPTILSTPPTGYGTVYTFGTGVGGTNVLPALGLEGGMQNYSLGGYNCLKAYSGTAVAEYGMIRFKATVSSIYVMLYPGTGSKVHLNRLPADGTTGIGTASGDVSPDGSLYVWKLLNGTLDSANEYIYEISFGGNGGTIIFGIMTVGGTGINTSVTGSTLVRQLLLAAIGDSRVADVNGTQGNPYVGHLALLGQQTNKQILNVGIPGQNLSAMVSRYTDITAYATVPSYILIDGGVNDIKTGSPPTPTQLVGYMASLINNIRAVGGAWATVPIYYELIKPADTSWVSGGYTYFDSYNTPLALLSGQYAANTAPGQVGGADANVHCIDTRTWNLAGSGWESGTAFDHTLYEDGIHLNSSLSGGSAPYGMVAEYGFLNAIFGTPATAITITNAAPPAGAPAHASAPIRVALSPVGGILSGTATVTPSDGGASGSFSPATVALTGASPSGTFAYTPSSAAGPRSVTITITNDKSLTNPSAITYTVQAEVVTVTPGGITYALTSTSSNWTGSPFSLVGGGAAAISAQAVTDTTHASITILANGTTGPWTVTDGTATFSVAQGGSGGTLNIFNSSILGRA